MNDLEAEKESWRNVIANQVSIIARLRSDNDRLVIENSNMRGVLLECEEYFDQRADGDIEGVNAEARLLWRVKRALRSS